MKVELTIILLWLATIIAVYFLATTFHQEPNRCIKEYNNCSKWYNQTICIDQNSIYYGCDVKAERCSFNYVDYYNEHKFICIQYG